MGWVKEVGADGCFFRQAVDSVDDVGFLNERNMCHDHVAWDKMEVEDKIGSPQVCIDIEKDKWLRDESKSPSCVTDDPWDVVSSNRDNTKAWSGLYSLTLQFSLFFSDKVFTHNKDIIFTIIGYIYVIYHQ